MFDNLGIFWNKTAYAHWSLRFDKGNTTFVSVLIHSLFLIFDLRCCHNVSKAVIASRIHAFDLGCRNGTSSVQTIRVAGLISCRVVLIIFIREHGQNDLLDSMPNIETPHPGHEHLSDYTPGEGVHIEPLLEKVKVHSFDAGIIIIVGKMAEEKLCLCHDLLPHLNVELTA